MRAEAYNRLRTDEAAQRHACAMRRTVRKTRRPHGAARLQALRTASAACRPRVGGFVAFPVAVRVAAAAAGQAPAVGARGAPSIGCPSSSRHPWCRWRRACSTRHGTARYAHEGDPVRCQRNEQRPPTRHVAAQPYVTRLLCPPEAAW